MIGNFMERGGRAVTAACFTRRLSAVVSFTALLADGTLFARRSFTFLSFPVLLADATPVA